VSDYRFATENKSYALSLSSICGGVFPHMGPRVEFIIGSLHLESQEKRGMVSHLISRGGLLAALGMLTSGFVVLYFISSGFSGSTEFQSNTTAIVPNGLLPGFIIGVLLLAFGAVELFSSVRL
jgi:hypothetical protein